LPANFFWFLRTGGGTTSSCGAGGCVGDVDSYSNATFDLAIVNDLLFGRLTAGLKRLLVIMDAFAFASEGWCA